MSVARARSRRIAIIGSGFSGLCLGIQLKKRGVATFTIFEKSDQIGGTWPDNTYPGACCDVPAFAYCFSFEQKNGLVAEVDKSLAASSASRYISSCGEGSLARCCVTLLRSAKERIRGNGGLSADANRTRDQHGCRIEN